MKVPPTLAGALDTVKVFPPPPDGTALIVDSNGFSTTCCGVPLSCTRMVQVDVPGVVGIPLIWPVDELSVNPAGKEPETTLHDKAPVPPVATSVVL